MPSRPAPISAHSCAARGSGWIEPTRSPEPDLRLARPKRGCTVPFRDRGFAPHGAGRNFSRTAYTKGHAGKTEAEMVREQTRGIDARFFCGIPDVSELPLAYKSAATVRAQIDEFGLAEIVDTIEPIGCIMAGNWQRNAPWRRKERHRHRR